MFNKIKEGGTIPKKKRKKFLYQFLIKKVYFCYFIIF